MDYVSVYFKNTINDIYKIVYYFDSCQSSKPVQSIKITLKGIPSF